MLVFCTFFFVDKQFIYVRKDERCTHSGQAFIWNILFLLLPRYYLERLVILFILLMRDLLACNY
jgi:hypothetical protein